MLLNTPSSRLKAGLGEKETRQMPPVTPSSASVFSHISNLSPTISPSNETMDVTKEESYEEEDEGVYLSLIFTFSPAFWVLVAAVVLSYSSVDPFFHIAVSFFESKEVH